MYGGHITDDWDRRLCKTYLEEYMKPEMVILVNVFFEKGLNINMTYVDLFNLESALVELNPP